MEGNLTAETICAFLGSFERSMTGPCPTGSRRHQPTNAHTRSGNRNLTSRVEHRVILARVHVRQRFTVRELVGDIRVFQKIDTLGVFEHLLNIANRS